MAEDKMSFQDFVCTRYEDIPSIALDIQKCKEEYKEYLED